MLYSINPYTKESITSYQEHSLAELDAMAKKADQAFINWKSRTYAERGACFEKLASLFIANKTEYATLITNETGKVFAEAKAEIQKCADGMRHYAGHAEVYLKDEPIEQGISYTTYQPLGVVFAIMPWNFPFWQTIRCAAPAIMAGNTVILKLAPNTTGCALALEKAFTMAGFPTGVFQTAVIQNDTSAYLIQKKEIKAISLTGSERAGVAVASEAGKNLKKVVLELGGSDPFIVLPDADIDKAVNIAIKSRLQNAGQSCVAAKRFILHTQIKNIFLEKLVEKLQAIKLGNPFDPDTHLGPLAKQELKNSLLQQVEKSVQLGARILSGKVETSNDCFFSPLVLEGLTPEMPAYKEELFGPVFAILEVRNEEEAILLANDTPYGLAASIWTSDAQKAKLFISQLDCGMVFVNEMVRSDARWGFGGIKQSGYGRELGEGGIKEFVNAKTVVIAIK